MMPAVPTFKGRRAQLELRIDREETLPDTFEDMVQLLHRWGIAREPQEVGYVVAFDSRRHVRTFIEVARGSASTMRVDLPGLFTAVMVVGSSRFIFIHNHPSGDPTPTGEDYTLTDLIEEGALQIGLYFEDHLIVTPNKKQSTSMFLDGLHHFRPYPVQE